MICSARRHLLIWSVILVLCALGASAIATAAAQDIQPQASVTLRWGARAGVLRYRLQLAKNATFSDIVFDRVVAGHEYRLTDLEPGRYFWRVASLNAKLGEFSSAGVIESPAKGEIKLNAPAVPLVSPKSKVAGPSRTQSIVSVGGWYAAIGNVTKSIVAQLRTSNSSEIVVATADGRVRALDANSGVAIWTRQPQAQAQRTGGGSFIQLLAVPASGGKQNILILEAAIATLIDGRTGRELWRTTLPGAAANALVSGSRVFAIDASLRKLFVIDAPAGELISQVALPRRAVGAPAMLADRGGRTAIVAFDDGGLQVLDETGKVVFSGNAGAPATTPALLVRTMRGEIVLVGTRNGLTALTADELRPLGRVTLKDDSPRGKLAAQDLDGDGVAEVVMFTERDRVVVVKSGEGRILWEADARQAESAAFADVDGDRVIDLLLASREGLALALSGRDGSVVWKDETPPNVATNHAPAASARTTFAVRTNSRLLLIAGDPYRGGVRAIEFQIRSK